MNNELTNVFLIMKREFPDYVEHFHLEENKEISSFLHYNAYNQMFIGTDDNYYHNVIFKNLDNGKKYRMFTEGFIFFFPLDDERINQDNDITIFSISNKINSLKINNTGLFVEKYDLNGNITVDYYDVHVVKKLSDEELCVGNINYIEEYLNKEKILPDRTVKFSVIGATAIVSTIENDEVINEDQIQIGKNRTIYSTFYEYMKISNSYSYYNQKCLQRKKD